MKRVVRDTAFKRIKHHNIVFDQRRRLECFQEFLRYVEIKHEYTNSSLVKKKNQRGI